MSIGSLDNAFKDAIIGKTVASVTWGSAIDQAQTVIWFTDGTYLVFNDYQYSGGSLDLYGKDDDISEWRIPSRIVREKRPLTNPTSDISIIEMEEFDVGAWLANEMKLMFAEEINISELRRLVEEEENGKT